MTFTVTVQDHMMVAHSLRGEVFGPAQQLHGATYVVSVAFSGPELTPDGILVDIGRAGETLSAVVAELNYRNLDDEPVFAGRNSTTELLAQHVADRVAERLGTGELGTGAASAVTALEVTLRESPVAEASYRRTVQAVA
jgi:6-pyruvoyl-tetrahydropterin synthase